MALVLSTSVIPASLALLPPSSSSSSSIKPMKLGNISLSGFGRATRIWPMYCVGLKLTRRDSFDFSVRCSAALPEEKFIYQDEVDTEEEEQAKEGENKPEVLYLVEPIDEIAIQNLKKFKEKKFVDISKEDLELGDEDEVKERETKKEYNLLGFRVKQMAKVQVSNHRPLIKSKQSFRRRSPKNARKIPKGIIHVQASFNNTIVTVTDVRGRVISWASTGACGFKGTKKGSPFAAQTATGNAIRAVVEQGMQRAEVMIKGPGLGRDAALRAIRRSGILLTFVRDVTPMPHNGCRPPKKRRV